MTAAGRGGVRTSTNRVKSSPGSSTFKSFGTLREEKRLRRGRSSGHRIRERSQEGRRRRKSVVRRDHHHPEDDKGQCEVVADGERRGGKGEGEGERSAISNKEIEIQMSHIRQQRQRMLQNLTELKIEKSRAFREEKEIIMEMKAKAKTTLNLSDPKQTLQIILDDLLRRLAVVEHDTERWFDSEIQEVERNYNEKTSNALTNSRYPSAVPST